MESTQINNWSDKGERSKNARFSNLPCLKCSECPRSTLIEQDANFVLNEISNSFASSLASQKICSPKNPNKEIETVKNSQDLFPK